MTTFAGTYIQEPGDFKAVATEAALIDAFLDVDTALPSAIDTFAELEASYPPEFASAVATANEVIADAENMVNAYARVQGYVIPLAKSGQPDPTAKSLAVRLAWIAARQRRNIISADQADQERERIQRSELRDIARGVLVLDVPRDTSTPAMATNVYAVTSSERTFSRELLDGL